MAVLVAPYLSALVSGHPGREAQPAERRRAMLLSRSRRTLAGPIIP